MEIYFKMWFKLLVVIGLAHPLFHGVSAQGERCRTPDLKDGVCLGIKSCKTLWTLLQTQGAAAGEFLRASLCKYENNNPIVCCPVSSNSNVDNSRHIKDLPTTPYGPLQPPYCGFSNASHTRVVGGTPAQLGAWPWVAVLGYRDPKNLSRAKWLCGGSLISSRHVLTAAHCVYRRNDLFIVRLGDLVLNSDDDGAEPLDILIEKKTPHPQYSSVNYINDIAVLRLQQEVPFTLHIHPICLPSTESMRSKTFVRTYPFVAGWGSVEYKGPISNQLMEVQLPVVTMESCKSAFARFKNVIIDDRVLCAGYAQGGKDACQGDSGGALMLPSKGIFHAIGVVSFGYQCAEPGYPGIYTRVTEFLSFIIEQMV